MFPEEDKGPSVSTGTGISDDRTMDDADALLLARLPTVALIALVPSTPFVSAPFQIIRRACLAFLEDEDDDDVVDEGDEACCSWLEEAAFRRFREADLAACRTARIGTV